ncbi:MAG: DUF928 domain-containing protein [Methylococcales bacterium]|nr:DUF928 domain-containing protein [Methylococcales bacterium]
MNKSIVKGVLISLLLLPTIVPAESPIMLNLPKTGAPETRIGGGTRGIGKSEISVQALAPAQTALTSQASPTLYFYVSGSSNNAIEFSIASESSGETLTEQNLPPVSKAGIQAVKLSDFNVQLEKGKEYRWTVAVVSDAENRGKDVISSATIRREDTNIALNDTKKLAEAGVWYDLLQTLSEQKSSQIPALLKQVDIQIGK